ncbi:MAG: AAA family ATPase [Armatimonadetes bacterium]|nr:AAA family ATPase [Armatimonadota bacterium]
MILERIRVQRFRGLDDFSADFAPGLNVVRGPNEAGKSTLQAAIISLLFDKPALAPTALNGVKSWRAEAAPVLSGVISVNGEEYLLTKDFEAREGVLTLPDGTRITDEKKIAAKITEISGVDSHELYVATACLQQQQWAQVIAGQKLQESLQQNLTGGAEGAQVQAILRALDRAIGNLELGRHRPSRNMGALKQVEDEIARTAEELDRAVEDYDRASRARLELEEANIKAEALESELAEAEALEKRVAKALELERQASELRKQADVIEKRVERITQLQGDIATLERGLADRPTVDETLAVEVSSWATRIKERQEELERDRADLRAMEDNRKRLEGELARLPQSTVSREQIDQARRLRADLVHARTEAAENARQAADCARQIAEGARQIAPRKALIIAGAIVAIAGIALSTLAPAYLAGAVAGLVLAAIGFSLRAPEGWRELPERLAQYKAAQEAAMQLAQRLETQLAQAIALVGSEDLDAVAEEIAENERQRIGLEAALESERSSIAVLEERINEREAIVRALQEKLDQALSTTGLDSVARLVEEAQSRSKALRLLHSRQDQLRGELGEQTLEELERRRGELAVELRGITEELKRPELALAVLSPTEYQELQTKIARLKEERKTVDATRLRCEAVLEVSHHDQDSVAQLEGRLSRLREKLGLLEERLAVYTLAREVIEQATNDVLSSVTENIAPRMGELLAQLTKDRYCQVELDNEMGPVVTCPGSDRQIGLGPGRRGQHGGLSCATREQVFLAARLALVDMLWPQGGPPLLLDDPLVNFDPDRRKAAVDALKSAAETHQVIVFTCGNDLDAAAVNIVEMPAPVT